MKKRIFYSALAVLCTVAIMASVIIPIHITTKAADTVIEPYVLDINPELIAFKDGAENLINNGGLENGNVYGTPSEQEALGTQFLNTSGFFRWDGTANVLRQSSGKTVADYYTIVTEDKNSGNRSLKATLGNDDWVPFDIYINVNNDHAKRLHDNTNYVLSFWAKSSIATPDWATDGHYTLRYDPKTDTTTHRTEQKADGDCGDDWGWRVYASQSEIDSTDHKKFSGRFTSSGVGVWKQYQIVFNTGNNAKLIKLKLSGLRGTVYYDDFELREMAAIPAKVTNNSAVVQNTKNENHLTYAYDFENLGEPSTFKGVLWHLNPASSAYNKYRCWSVSNADKHGGEASLKYTAPQNAGEYIDLWYTLSNLKKFTTYAVSFWANSNDANADMLKIIRGDGKTIKDYTSGSAQATYKYGVAGWKKHTYLIDTGEDIELNLILFGRSANVYFDDFCVFELSGGIAPYITDNLAGNVLYNEADNHISQGSFENLPASADWSNFLYPLRDASTSKLKNYFSITEEEAVSGTHSLKFTGDGNDYGGFWISNDNSKKLTPNTEYVFTFRVKGEVDENPDYKIFYNGATIKDYTVSEEGKNAQYSTNSVGWKRYSYTFNSGDATELSLILINTVAQTQYFDDFAIVERAKLIGGIVNSNPTVDRLNCDPADNLIVIADFEQDITQNSFWSYLLNRDIKENGTPIAKVGDYLQLDNTVSHTGNASLRYRNTVKGKHYYMPIDIRVNKYSEYAFSFWAKGEQLDGGELGWQIQLDWDSGTRDYTDINNPKSPAYKLSTETIGEWTRYSYIIQTGGKEYISFQISDNGGTMWFDNFQLFETTNTKPMDATVVSVDDNVYLIGDENNLIANGNLSKSDLSDNWGSLDATTGISYGTDEVLGYGGKSGYLQYNGGDNTNGIYTKKFSLMKNTTYTLSFKYNTITAGVGKLKVGIALDNNGTAISNIDIGSDINGLRVIEKAVGWNHISVTFSTNTAKDVWLTIKSEGNAGNIILDDFALYLAENGADKILDESVNIRPGKDWYGVGATPAGYSVKGGISGENNLISSGDFETMPQGDWNVPTFLNGAATLTTEEAYSGKTSLKFSAHGKKVSSVYWVKVQPQKMYVFQAMVKAYGIDADNKGDLQFGIISTETGKFINCPDPEQTNYTIWDFYKAFTQDTQLNPNAWEGEWASRGMYFTNDTDEVKTVGIYITAKDSTVYFDDIMLAEANDFVYVYKAADAGWQTALYGTQVEDTICNESDNLIKDGMLKSNAAWKDIRNYGKFLTVNTEVERLCYVGTGHYANYFRWFDVKPDTVYTFSVYCKGEERGNMSFGLCDSRSNGYKDIGGKEGKWSPTYDGVWYQYSIQFDSGNFDKIGFYVCDGGGVADFAKFRLFESSKGSPFVESDIPPGGRVIEKDKGDTLKPTPTDTTDEEDDEDDGGKKIVQSNKKVKKHRKIIIQNNWLVIGLIIGGVVLAIAAATVVIIILVKKKKRKQQVINS